MRRRTIVELVLLAYPESTRAMAGAEMAATALDVSAGSATRFARELADLLRLGLRARTSHASHAGLRRLIADGLCLAAVWQITLDLSTLLAQRVRGLHDPLLAWPSIAALAAILALALIGYDRLAGVGAVIWSTVRLPEIAHHHPAASLGAVLLSAALPLLCFAVLLLAPRRRPPDARRLAWLVVPVLLVATLGPSHGEQSPLLLALVALGAIAAVVAALAMLPADPRLALAGAVPLSNLGIGVFGTASDPAVALFIAATPCVLILVGVRAARRAAPAEW
jgi:hypothetical protein